MAFSVARANEINHYIGRRDTIIIDLRDESSFYKEHIQGAINIPYERIEEESHQFHNYSIVILYCERGNTSLLVAKEYDNPDQLLLTLAGGFNRNKTKFVIDGIQ